MGATTTMRLRTLLLPLLLALGAGACSDGKSVVLVTVGASTSDPVAGVRKLHVVATNNGMMATVDYDVTPAATIPPAKTLVLILGGDRKGGIDVTVEALGDQGHVLKSGKASGTIAAGSTLDLPINLTEGGGVDGGTADVAVGTDLAGVDLAGADLAGADLRPPPDLATPIQDGSLPADSSVVVVDMGGLNSSAQLQQVRNAASGPDAGIDIPIPDVVVTYVKPATGVETGGFFVQADPTGPAIFVAVEPGTLNPVPAAGDRVTFHVTSAGLLTGVRQATSISGYARLGTGTALAPFIQDLSNKADVVSSLDGYESELVTISGTVTGAFTTGGIYYVAANMDTPAILGNASLRFRIPEGVRDQLDVVQGCTIKVTGPLWRFNTQAQPSAFRPSEVQVSGCPAPGVINAVAGNPSVVRIFFDRRISPTSVNITQFVIPGLAISAATVTDRVVRLTTSAQGAGMPYTVTVGAVTDMQGVTLDGARNAASFVGSKGGPTILINEVSPNISGGTDLIELLIVGGNTTLGVTLEQDLLVQTILVTLPDLPVMAGDLIVVHTNPLIAGVTTELINKTDCTSSACFPGAWDVAASTVSVNGGTGGINQQSRVILVRGPAGLVQDGVPFHKTNLNGNPPEFVANLQLLQGAGGWAPGNCSGAPCTYITTPSAYDLSVDWTGVGVTATGPSMYRRLGANSKQKSDWALSPTSSFGVANPP